MARDKSDFNNLTEAIIQSIVVEGFELDEDIELRASQLAQIVIQHNSIDDEDGLEIEELNFDYNDNIKNHSLFDFGKEDEDE